MLTVAQVILAALGLYALLGLAFATVFVAVGIGRIDPAARGASLAVRLLLFPGSAALWPVLLARWARASATEARR